MKPNGLFVAVRGFKEDGTRFIDDAIKKGASAIVSEIPVNAKVPVILVKDSRRALSALSAEFYGRPSEKMIVIGVTGTNGKTTVSSLLEKVFKDQGYKTGLIGTVVYKVMDEVLPALHTTPESVDLQYLFHKMLNKGVNVVIMEVSSHSLVLKRVEDVEFDAAIFTNLTRDHLDFHKNFSNYFYAKKHLFELLKKSNKKEKFGVINIDDPYGRRLVKELKGIKIITYGKSKNSAVKVSNVKLNFGSTTFSWDGLEVSTSLSGDFNLYNTLAVIVCAEGFRLKRLPLLKSLKEFKPVKGRFETIKKTSNDPLIIIDYAHTDDALKNVLTAINKLKSSESNIITVFGCGGDRDKTKRPIMGKIATELSDKVIITSDNPRTEDPLSIIDDILKGINDKSSVIVEPDRHKAIRLAVKLAGKKDIILIAGKGHETYQIFKDRTIKFDDSLEAKIALRLRKKR